MTARPRFYSPFDEAERDPDDEAPIIPEAAVPDHHHLSPGAPSDPATQALEARRSALFQLGQAMVLVGRAAAVLAAERRASGG